MRSELLSSTAAVPEVPMDRAAPASANQAPAFGDGI